MRALVSLVLLASAWSSIARAEVELPLRKYTLTDGGPELCFEPLPGRRLKLTLKSQQDRDPYVLEGPYVVTANKMADFHVTFTVESIKHRTLGPCRKFWYVDDATQTTQLDTVIKRGARLMLTAHYECADRRESVQLCLHDAGADGKQVVCRVLRDFRAPACTPPPPIDGAKINAPAPHP
jgi:hypothetical protein